MKNTQITGNTQLFLSYLPIKILKSICHIGSYSLKTVAK